jgi:hypothetical protein
MQRGVRAHLELAALEPGLIARRPIHHPHAVALRLRPPDVAEAVGARGTTHDRVLCQARQERGPGVHGRSGDLVRAKAMLLQASQPRRACLPLGRPHLRYMRSSISALQAGPHGTAATPALQVAPQCPRVGASGPSLHMQLLPSSVLSPAPSLTLSQHPPSPSSGWPLTSPWRPHRPRPPK